MARGDLYGDVDLASGLRGLLRSGHPAAAAAVVTPAGSRTASYTAPIDAEVEIGSLSKCLTGMLYADALRRGTVTPTTRLRELLPLDGCPAGDIELAALAAHRSGLPRLPAMGSEGFVRTWHLWVDGENPYGDTLDQLLEQTRATPVGKPKHSYSNLGYELLGHAVAAAESVTYAELLRARVAEPLGLQATYVASTRADLRPAAVEGTSRSGRRREPWTGEALGPAGGIRSTVGDMAVLTRALLDGTAPGAGALEPVERFSGPAVRIGAAWLVLSRKGREITWHNGQTGGFASWWGLDRVAGTGVVILSLTAAGIDRHGFELLEAVTSSA
jgi:CubicO group peptidase (beta-lactamase class C family)